MTDPRDIENSLVVGDSDEFEKLEGWIDEDLTETLLDIGAVFKPGFMAKDQAS